MIVVYVFGVFDEYYIFYVDCIVVCVFEYLVVVGFGKNGMVRVMFVEDGWVIGCWMYVVVLCDILLELFVGLCDFVVVDVVFVCFVFFVGD